MEQQLERRREPEPVAYSRNIEMLWERLDNITKAADKLPHVAKFDELPWSQNAMTYWKTYTGEAGLPSRLTRLPIRTLDLREQNLCDRADAHHRPVAVSGDSLRLVPIVD